MALTYRKPKDVEHALQLVNEAKVKVLWDICKESNLELSKHYFDMYKPIVFVYQKNKLVAAAHNKFGSPEVIGLDDNVITNTYSVTDVNDIDMAIKQLELF